MTAQHSAEKAEHLTEAQRRAGVLVNASVLEVEVASAGSTILPRIIRLRLAYDGDAADARDESRQGFNVVTWRRNGIT